MSIFTVPLRLCFHSCPFLCLLVGFVSRVTQKTQDFTKFGGRIRHGPRKNSSDSGTGLDKGADPGIWVSLIEFKGTVVEVRALL